MGAADKKKISRSENSRWGRPVDEYLAPTVLHRPFCVSLPNQVLLSGDDVVIDEQQRPTHHVHTTTQAATLQLEMLLQPAQWQMLYS